MLILLILDIADCKVSGADENTIPYHTTNVQCLMWTMIRILMMLMVLSVVSSNTLFDPKNNCLLLNIYKVGHTNNVI